MIEIFDNIPMSVKMDTELIFKIATMQKDVIAAAKMLNDYVNSCKNLEEKEYADFYFQMKFEELKNGSSLD